MVLVRAGWTDREAVAVKYLELACVSNLLGGHVGGSLMPLVVV